MERRTLAAAAAGFWTGLQVAASVAVFAAVIVAGLLTLAGCASGLDADACSNPPPGCGHG